MKPLEDILIIDFSQFLSGPSAGLRLADLGARVIKVEQPGTGDICRHLYTSNVVMNGESSVFHAINRNKESFVADLKQEKGKQQVWDLVKKADVLITNFRPGVMERLGFDYNSVKKENPQIIYGEITGYGHEGPWRTKPGQDLLAQSLTGLTWLSGNGTAGPVPMGVAVVDIMAGAHLAQGILACLVRRGVNGSGGLVQVSMMEASFDFQFETITTFLNDGGVLPERSQHNNAHAYLGAPYGIYQTENGYIALAMGVIPVLGDLLQCEPLLDYREPELAYDKRDEIKAILAQHLLTKTTEDWLAVLEPADIWCADVMSWDRLMAHEGFKVLDMIQSVEMKDGYRYQTTRCPIRLNGQLLTSRKGSPKMGEDNEKILKELQTVNDMAKDTLRIAVRQFGPFESAVRKIWERYRHEHGVSAELEMVPLELHDLYHTTIKDGGLSSGEWDVAVINTDWILEGHATGAVEDLAPYLKNNPPDDYPDGWSPSLLSLQQFGKAVTGLPFHDGPECLIYRKDLFNDRGEQERFYKKYNRQLQPPETWEDYLQVAAFFQRPAEGLYGTVVAGFPDGHNTVFDFCLQLWTRGGELTDSQGNIQIDTPAAIEGLEFYRTLLNNENVIHPGSREFESVRSGEAFARGEVAMMVNWFGFASVCEVSSGSKVKGKVDITHLPKAPFSATASLNVYYLYVLGSGSDKKELAYDFIRYAVNARNDKLLTLEGGIGCRISTWNDGEINAAIPYYHKLESLHRYARALPQKDNWSAIAAIIDEVVLQAVDTARPVGEILKEAQLKIQDLDQKIQL